MSTVLISYHTFSGKTRVLAEAAAEGVRSTGAETVLKEVTATSLEDVVAADAVLIATPQPFRTIAGETKKLFERLWKDRDQIAQDKPLGLIVCHATGPDGALDALEKLGAYYKFARTAEGVAVKASEVEAGLESCRQLGAALGQRSQVSAL